MTPSENTRPHLLLVDDDRLVLATLARSLQTLGWSVSCAASAEDARAEFDYGLIPDLALLDMRLPGDDGLALAQQLRDHWQTPFLMLSAYDDTDTVQRAAALGALGYLVKPLDPAHIAPTLATALARARERQQLHTAHEQMQEALTSQRQINVAIDITMVQLRLPREAAFNTLRAAARAQRRKLSALAQELIDRCEVQQQGT